MTPDYVLILGASARAAAFSALRAGLRPWCADLFADADLRLRCPAVRLEGRYPAGFAALFESAPPGPWLYTGGLENHPRLVRRLARRRPLWGNDAEALLRARDPAVLARAARAAGLPAPALATAPGPGRWLLKPRAGAGGSGIRFCREGEGPAPAGAYLQEFIAGPAAGAVYVAAAGSARLLGLTRQLVGEGWLHAPPFRYCGSVGPLAADPPLASALCALGGLLAREAGLRGLFGIDGILRDGAFWPVEVNPRYPASVEVLEHATGLLSLRLHRLAFEDPPAALAEPLPGAGGPVVGKAVLYARAALAFPPGGPWLASLDAGRSVEEMSEFADLPHPGERIGAGRPVLTTFARAAREAACLEALRGRAAAAGARLYAGG